MLLKTVLLSFLAIGTKACYYGYPYRPRSSLIGKSLDLSSVNIFTSAYQQVVADNAAKFTVGTADEVAQKMKTLTSFVAASTEAPGVLKVVADALTGGTTDVILDSNCKHAYRNSAKFHYTFDSIYSLNDWNLLYALRYIDGSQFDNHLEAVKACLGAMGQGSVSSHLDSVKSTIIQYPGKIDIDWTKATISTIPGVPLTAAQQADFYTFLSISGRQWCRNEYFYNSDNGATPIFPAAITQFNNAPANAITTINALETSWNFADIGQYNDYRYIEDVEDYLEMPNEFNKLLSHIDSIVSAFGFSASTTPSLVQMTTAYTGAESCKARFENERTIAKASYNALPAATAAPGNPTTPSKSAMNTFGMLSLFLVMLTKW